MDDRERVVRELHDAMGDCDLCEPERGPESCDVKCQLRRAYAAGQEAASAAAVKYLRANSQAFAEALAIERGAHLPTKETT